MDCRKIAHLLLTTAQTALLCVGVSLKGAQAAYDYAASQISPVALTMPQIATILNQIDKNGTYLDQYQLMTITDTTGAVASLAPLKVVQTGDPNRPYLGVFHNQVTTKKFATYAAYSTDLVNWHTLGAIDDIAAGEYGSQPDIRILNDDTVLFAEEYNPASRPQIRLRYYGAGVEAFMDNPGLSPTYQKVLPNINIFSGADGTPEFARIDYNGSVLSSKFEVTHHYFNFRLRDIQAIGTLSNFQTWSDNTDTRINNLVTNAGGNGKIGDREFFEVGSTVYEVVEAQVNPSSSGDFGSWRLFLINRTATTIQKLSPVLVGGAVSLGNPTVSFVTLPEPDGGPALIFTCFVFSENRKLTAPGGHMYVYRLAQPQP